MDKQGKYVILWETLNHTLVFLVSAQSEEEALRSFVLHESSCIRNEPDGSLTIVDQFDTSFNESYRGIRELIKGVYVDTDARFEVQKVKRFRTNEVTDLFCSKDQIYDIEPNRLNHFLETRHLQLALTYAAHDRYAEAKIEFTQALSLYPLRFKTLSGLAQCHFNLGELEQSVNIYNDVIASTWATETETVDAHRELGAIFRASGDSEAAEQHAQIYFTWENS